MQDAGTWAATRHVFPGEPNRLLYTIIDELAENRKIPESKFRPVFIVRHYLTNNFSFINLQLHINLCRYLFHSITNIDRNDRITMHERETVIKYVVKQRSKITSAMNIGLRI